MGLYIHPGFKDIQSIILLDTVHVRLTLCSTPFCVMWLIGRRGIAASILGLPLREEKVL